LPKLLSAPGEGTFEANETGRRPKVIVSAASQGTVSRARGLLLETLRATGLSRGL
jgi:hypothetical protein